VTAIESPPYKGLEIDASEVFRRVKTTAEISPAATTPQQQRRQTSDQRRYYASEQSEKSTSYIKSGLASVSCKVNADSSRVK